MISFYPVQEIEPPVGSETRADENSKDQVSICVEPELQSPRVDSINPNASFRSKSSGSMSRLNKKSFLRSHSTGHLLFQSDEKYERFTLQLPDDVRNQLVNPTLNHGSNDVAFTSVNSTRKGYRSGRMSKWHGSGYFNYERFDREGQGESEPWRFTLTRPFFSRTSSIRSQENGDNDEVKHTPPTNLSIPGTSSFDGERSSGHLRAQSQI
jgi:E3 ubiquitin-protein ligase ATL6/9/15/31/42/55